MEDDKKLYYDVGQYFQSMSSIAKRLWEDVETCKESYEDAWSYLSREEQDQVVNESVIHPEAVLKYSLIGKSGIHEQESEKRRPGRKIIEDELGLKWEDEYSAPFSWFTRSQTNLDRAGASEIKVIPAKTKARQETISKPQKSPSTEEPAESNGAIFAAKEVLETKSEIYQSTQDVEEEIQSETETKSYHESEKRNDAVNEAEVSETSSCDDTTTSDIPRSGFEFLDNW